MRQSRWVIEIARNPAEGLGGYTDCRLEKEIYPNEAFTLRNSRVQLMQRHSTVAQQFSGLVHVALTCSVGDVDFSSNF